MSAWVGSSPWVGSLPWVHPSSSGGWIGSGFECACDCGFVGGFHYEGNEPANWGFDPLPICMLTFSVGNLANGCTIIDVEDADLTIELRVNGNVINEPMLYDTTNNLVYWQRWKPTAGDVYTATVTLDCGSSSVTQEFSFTIPTPANTNCRCCDERDVDYIVIDGFTGDFAVLNGTYAATPVGNNPSCCYTFQGVAAPPLPANPCGIQISGVLVGSIPPECLFFIPSPSGVDPTSQTGYYYYPGSGSIVGILAGSNQSAVCIGEGLNSLSDVTRFRVLYSYMHTRRRAVDRTFENPEGCVVNGGGSVIVGGQPVGGPMGHSVDFEIDCRSGMASMSNNTFPSGQSPTLEVFFK